jgi:hypothetical protein
MSFHSHSRSTIDLSLKKYVILQARVGPHRNSQLLSAAKACMSPEIHLMSGIECQMKDKVHKEEVEVFADLFGKEQKELRYDHHRSSAQSGPLQPELLYQNPLPEHGPSHLLSPSQLALVALLAMMMP